MGQIAGTFNTRHVALGSDALPSFGPNIGFSGSRKEREFSVPEEEFISAKIPHQFRDYCGRQLLDYQVCRYDEFPFVYKCHHEKHAYLNCEQADYVIRMKEFEREKRLREREIRLTGEMGDTSPFINESSKKKKSKC